MLWSVEDVHQLQHAIVRQAVYDYLKAYRDLEWDAVDELEAWFVSDWGQILCEDCGRYIAERCREMAQGKEENSMAVYVVELDCIDGQEQIIKERLERFLGRYGRVRVTIERESEDEE